MGSSFLLLRIQTDAVSKLVKLESCACDQTKALFKSFSFHLFPPPSDRGKGVKLNFEECVFCIRILAVLPRPAEPPLGRPWLLSNAFGRSAFEEGTQLFFLHFGNFD